MQKVTRKQYLSYIKDRLFEFEQALREYVMEDCDKAEEECARLGYGFDDYVEQDDGTEVGVVYTENASPDLDAAVHNLWEAQMSISEALENDV